MKTKPTIPSTTYGLGDGCTGIVETKLTLEHTEINNWICRTPNMCWSSARERNKDTSEVIIKSRVIVGTNKTKSVVFRKLCIKEHDEDYIHFLITFKRQGNVKNTSTD